MTERIAELESAVHAQDALIAEGATAVGFAPMDAPLSAL
jgi:hypothetical protein